MDHDQILSKEDKHELFNERAGIREFEAGFNREEAERLANEDVERHRHRCEIRTMLRKADSEGPEAIGEYLLKVERARGAESAERLRAEARAQWQAGNRGKDGEWRELGLK